MKRQETYISTMPYTHGKRTELSYVLDADLHYCHTMDLNTDLCVATNVKGKIFVDFSFQNWKYGSFLNFKWNFLSLLFHWNSDLLQLSKM